MEYTSGTNMRENENILPFIVTNNTDLINMTNIVKQSLAY